MLSSQSLIFFIKAKDVSLLLLAQHLEAIIGFLIAQIIGVLSQELSRIRTGIEREKQLATGAIIRKTKFLDPVHGSMWL